MTLSETYSCVRCQTHTTNACATCCGNERFLCDCLLQPRHCAFAQFHGVPVLVRCAVHFEARCTLALSGALSPSDDLLPRYQTNPRLARSRSGYSSSHRVLDLTHSLCSASFPATPYSRSSSSLPVPASRLLRARFILANTPLGPRWRCYTRLPVPRLVHPRLRPCICVLCVRFEWGGA